jgi:two-component system response regulator YesN
MKTILRLKQAARSLFIRLFISFMLIIALLSSFNFLSFTFFRGQLQEEVITYNQVNLKQTKDSYETHLQLVSNFMLGFYNNDHVQIFSKNREAYDIANKIRIDIRTTVTNPLFYLENLVLHYQDTNMILEKDGSSDAERMFAKFYVSGAYSYKFWLEQFQSPDYFQIHPASEFREMTFTNSSTSKGTLIPLVIKNRLNPGLNMIALLDAQKMFASFHRSINDNFVILDNNNRVIYTAGSPLTDPLPDLPKGQSYVQNEDSYFFYNQGEFSGLTYINIIPNKDILSKISKLNLTLLSLLLVAIAIGIGTSILFSMHFNNPVKKIVSSIRSLNTGDSAGISSNEFEQINMTIERMFQKNKDINQVLDERNSLLKYYSYLNKVKNIHNSYDDFKEFPQQDKPYCFVLYQLFFTAKFNEEAEVNEARATYFLREIIRQYMLTNFKESHTFQVENDQILTVVFMEEGEPDLNAVLDSMISAFEHDKELCFMTIALSPIYEQSADFTIAYETVLGLTEARKLNDEMQVIDTAETNASVPLTLTASQEQEFEVNLRAGNETVVIPLISRVLGSMQRKGATANQMKAFAEMLIDGIVKVLVLLNIDYKSGGDFQEMSREVKQCHTLEQMDALLGQALGTACRLIQMRKDQRDPMTTFVLDYLESHYNEDITLDSVAEKLDISGGYLSTYFKEKTGKNFIDYVHELRIDKAKELLLRSDHKIQDAAAQVGYNNLNSFNRMFKKYTGMTPSEFRRNKT